MRNEQEDQSRFPPRRDSQRTLDNVKGSIEVDASCERPYVVRDVQKGEERTNAGVGDETVNSAERLHGDLHNLYDGSEVSLLCSSLLVNVTAHLIRRLGLRDVSSYLHGSPPLLYLINTLPQLFDLFHQLLGIL